MRGTITMAARPPRLTFRYLLKTALPLFAVGRHAWRGARRLQVPWDAIEPLPSYVDCFEDARRFNATTLATLAEKNDEDELTVYHLC